MRIELTTPGCYTVIASNSDIVYSIFGHCESVYIYLIRLLLCIFYKFCLL